MRCKTQMGARFLASGFGLAIGFASVGCTGTEWVLVYTATIIISTIALTRLQAPTLQANDIGIVLDALLCYSAFFFFVFAFSGRIGDIAQIVGIVVGCVVLLGGLVAEMLGRHTVVDTARPLEEGTRRPRRDIRRLVPTERNGVVAAAPPPIRKPVEKPKPRKEHDHIELTVGSFM